MDYKKEYEILKQEYEILKRQYSDTKLKIEEEFYKKKYEKYENYKSFSLAEFNKLCDTDFEKAKEYFNEYFVMLSNKKIAHKTEYKNIYDIMSFKGFKIIYLDRMRKPFVDWLLHENKDIKTIVYESDKPLFYDDKINLFKETFEEYFNRKYTFNL